MKTNEQWLQDMESRPCVTRNDLLVIIKQIQDDAAKEPTQRAVNAEMELLALKSPQIPPDVRARMDADRKRSENRQPEWLNQALNEGDGTYKP